MWHWNGCGTKINIVSRDAAKTLQWACHRMDDDDLQILGPPLPPALAASPSPAAPPSSNTEMTFCPDDMSEMFSFRTDIDFLSDSCRDRIVCCSPGLTPLTVEHRLLGGGVSRSCGKHHRKMPPSTLVLTKYWPSGLTLTLVTTPAWPTPTCVGTPSLYSQTFTVWSELPVTKYLPVGQINRSIVGM